MNRSTQLTKPTLDEFKTVNNTLNNNSPISDKKKSNKKYINIVTSLTENTLDNNNLNFMELDAYLKN